MPAHRPAPVRGAPRLLALLALFVASPVAAQVVGPDRCGECHQLELHAWKDSKHQLGYRTLHRTPAAKAAGAALGFKRVKQAERCAGCHYTVESGAAAGRPIAGVSCESCHGAADAWLAPHSDYGGPLATADTETAAHRAERRARSVAAGMAASFNLYPLVDRCFGCHVVADRELLAKTAHPAVSREFDLVAWSQGEVRHNYFFSADKTNRPATNAQRRQLHVLGRLLGLAHTLEAMASAPADSRMLDELRSELQHARDALAQIQKAATLPEIAPLSELDLSGTNPDIVLGSAGALRAAARRVAAREPWDGAALAGLDPLLAPAAAIRGTARP